MNSLSFPLFGSSLRVLLSAFTSTRPHPVSQSSPWWRSIYFHHGLRTALSGLLALYLAESLRLRYPQWSLFTVMVLMIVHYPGSIALKSLYRVVGTLVGGVLGVWLVTDYFTTPTVLLGVTFLFISFATYQLGKYGSRFGPYAFFLSGFTLLTVETSALSQPWEAWTFALSRGEEVFVGILTTLLVGLIVRPRHPLPEFQEILRSICRESGFLISCDINDPIDSPRVDAQQRLLLRQILRSQGLLAALGREGLNFSANIALLSKAYHSVDRVVRAVIDLQDLRRHQVNSAINDLRLATEFDTVQASIGRALSDSPNQLKPDLTDLNEAVNQLEARVMQFLQSWSADSLQVDDLSALLRRWNILKEIYEELIVLNQFEGQLEQTRLDSRSAPFQLRLPQIDRRLFLSGLKGGLATVISLLLVVWLHLPGGGEVSTAAWTALLTTSCEIPLGRPGDLRSMKRLMVMALVGLVCMISELLWMPYLSNYWILNVSLFAILFGYGYFSSKQPGMPFWMLFVLLNVSNLVSVNPQQPVPSASIIDLYVGMMTGFTIGIVLSRCLWPVLPQKELLRKAQAFFDGCASLIEPAGAAETTASILKTEMLPLQMAQANNALAVNAILRQERERWTDLLLVLMRLSRQLQRFQSLDSRATRDSLTEKLIAYLQRLKDTFSQAPPGINPHFFEKEIALFKDELQRVAQDIGILKKAVSEPLRRLLDINERLLTAELCQRCGRLVASLRPDQYNGDYFL